jgi:transposase
MTIPGVGPVVALTYRATVDVPARFRNSKGGRGGVWTDTRQVSVGRERPNRRNIAVRRRDDADDALRSGPKYAGAYGEVVLAQAWAMKIARHRGMKKAIVALARRLAVIIHRMWVDGTEFRWTREVAAA